MKQLLIICSILLCCVGCGSMDTSHHSPSSYMTENQNTDIPNRVIAVWQNSVETLIALGEGHRIVAAVGVPSDKYIRPEYRDVYRSIPYKSTQMLDLETALMLKADFIVGWRTTFMNKTLQSTEYWNNRGVRTYVAQSSNTTMAKLQTIEAEYAYIRDLGSIFHKEEVANTLIGSMEGMIAHTIEQTKNQPMPTVAFIEIEGKMLRLYGKNTLAGNIGTRLHGHVVDTGERFISMEDLITIDPDVIFLIVSDGSYDEADSLMAYIKNQSSLQRLKAIRENHIYFLPLLAVYSPGIRLVDGITIISHGLYPSVYPEGVPDYLH